MKQHRITADIVQKNEKSIHQIIRTIQLSDGQFALIIANCNYYGLQKIIIEHICKISNFDIMELPIPPSENTIYSYVKSTIGSKVPDALFIDNLDKNKNIDNVLLAANQVREEFRKKFNCPVIFWMDDDILDKFVRLAPDFRSWAGSPIRFNLSDRSLNLSLPENADVLVQSFIDHNDQLMKPSLYVNLSDSKQLQFFLNDIKNRDISLSPDNQADLQFIEGYSKEFHSQWPEALDCLKNSYQFWSVHKQVSEPDNLNKIFKRLLALKYLIASCHEHTGTIDDAIQHLQDCLSIIENQQIISLPVINYLCMLQKIAGYWKELEQTSQILLNFGHETQNLFIQAKSYQLLAEATLHDGEISQTEKTTVQLASKALDILSSYQLKSNDDECEYIKVRDHSLFILSQSYLKNDPPDMDQAANLLEKIIAEGIYECDPTLYIQSLDDLRKVYSFQKKYSEAFTRKKDRQSLEQQFGYKAFIGAGRIKARRQVHGMKTIDSDDIQATGRQAFIDELKNRIQRRDRKLIIIHGQSGVGKSSILEADVEPKLRQMIIDSYEVQPLLIRTYTDWKKNLGDKLSGLLSKQTINAHHEFNVLEWIKSELQLNSERHIFVVFIFDQFEEFFFTNPELSQRREFYSFIKDCLNIPFVNIVLSLREDYLHYLLECNRAVDLEIINNDILTRDIRHPLGNFSKPEAISVIQTLTEHTHFQMEDILIKKMVDDLADENGEIRPIELQIVGYQMQETDIRTLEQYKKKEELIHDYIKDVIIDCGKENEKLAWLILYLLTDEKNFRPLKTKDEILKELHDMEVHVENDQLNIIFDILTGSGLIFIIPDKPSDKFQIIHDYLVEYIRKGEAKHLLFELEVQKIKRLEQEKRLKEDEKKEQARKKKLLRWSMSLGIVFAIISVVAVLFGIESQTQKNRAIQAEQNVRKALEKSAIALANEGHRARLNHDYEISLLHYKRSLEASDNISAKIGASESLSKVIPELARFEEKKGVSAICFSPNGDYLAYASNDYTIHILETDTWKEVYTCKDHKDKVKTMMFHPQKNWLFSVSYEWNIFLWKMNTASKLGLIGAERIKNENEKHDYTIYDSISISTDGKKMITVCGSNNKIRQWQIGESSIFFIKEDEYQKKIQSVFYNPDGYSYAVIFEDQNFLILNKPKKESINYYDTFKKKMNIQGIFLCFCSNDEFAYIDPQTDNMLIVNTKNNKKHEMHDISLSREPIRNVININDRIVMLAQKKKVRLWNTQITPWPLLKQLKIYPSTGEFIKYASMPSKTGQYLVTVSNTNTIHIWVIDPELYKKTFMQIHKKSVRYINHSKNDNILISLSDKLRVQNTQSKEDISIPQSLNKPISSVSLSPESNRLAIAYEDCKLKLWDIRYKVIWSLSSKLKYPATTLDINASGTQVIATSDRDWDIHFIDIQDQRLEIRSKTFGSKDIHCMKYSPDGLFIATGSKNGSVSVLKLQNNNYSVMLTIDNSEGPVCSILFSNDSQQMAASFKSGVIRIWDTDSFREFGTCWGHDKPVNALQFILENSILVSASDDKSIRFWNVELQKEISRFDFKEQITFISPIENIKQSIHLYFNQTKAIVNREIYFQNIKNQISQYYNSAYPWEFNASNQPVARQSPREYALERYNKGIPWLKQKEKYRWILKKELDTASIEESVYQINKAIDKNNEAKVLSLLKLHNYNDLILATTLTEAIEKGLESVIQYLIKESGLDLDMKDYNEKMPLEVAAFHNHQDIMRLLLDKGANINNAFFNAIDRKDIMTLKVLLNYDINIEGKKKYSDDRPLIKMVSIGNKNLVEILVNKGADVNFKKTLGMTPVMRAAANGYIDIVKLLIEKGADITIKDYRNSSTLSIAAQNNNIDIVKLLIEKWKDIPIKNREDKSIGRFINYALLKAVEKGHNDIAQLLIENGADISASFIRGQNNNKIIDTILISAINNGQVETAQLLIEQGADFSVKKSNGWTALMCAVSAGNIEIVKLLIEKGADFSIKSNFGWTALMAAASNGHIDVVRFLLEKGADLSIKTNDGWTALMIAASNGHIDIVRFLLEKGADLSIKINNGWTALMIAAQNGHIDVVKYLLEKDADLLSIKSNNGWTALMIAAKNGHIDILRFLIEKDAKVSDKSNDGWTVLMAAASNGHINIVGLLLEKGVDLSDKSNDGWTALMSAALNGHIDVVKFLLEKGADFSIKNNNGLTALMIASANGHIDVVRFLLLEKGADFLLKNNYDWTALMYAASNGHIDVVNFLLEKGADFSIKNNDDSTALIAAASNGHFKMVEFLIDKGVDYSIKNNNGLTALMAATNNDHTDIAHFLLKKDADFSIKNNSGSTALILAAKNGHRYLAETLIEKGADVSIKNNNGNTALMFAAKNGHINIIKLLLEKGADFTIKNNNDWTALMFAANQGHIDMVKLLIEKGSDFSIKNINDSTALMLAAENGHIDVVKFLFNEKVNLLSKDKNPWTIYEALYNLTNATKYLCEKEGWKALILAASNGHINVVNYFLGKGVNLSLKNNNGWTALMAASSNGHLDVVKILTEKGADFSIKNNNGLTALMLAAENGHYDVVTFLLKKGADFSIKNNNDSTAFILAAENGHYDVVTFLFGEMIHLLAEDKDGWTLSEYDVAINYVDAMRNLCKNKEILSALIAAASNGHIEVVNFLSVMGMNLSIKNKAGWTALMAASSNGHVDVIKRLIRKGADFSIKNNYGWTALMAAANNGHIDVVKLLLEKGADVSVKSNDGWTALMAASSNGHADVVKILIEKEADCAIKNHYGWTALMLAANYGHNEIVKLLLEKGADVLVKSNDGWTALLVAVSNGHFDVVKLLIEKGVGLSDKNNLNFSTLMAAASNGHIEIVKFLLKKGADLSEKDSYGWNALMYSASNGHKDIVQLLIEQGTNVQSRTNIGQTTSMIACQNDNITVCNLLIGYEGLDIEKAKISLDQKIIKPDQKLFDSLICFGGINKSLEKKEHALKCFQKALEIAELTSDNIKKAQRTTIALENLLILTQDDNNYLQLLTYYTQKLEADLMLHKNKKMDDISLSGTYVSLSWYLVLTRQYKKAISVANEALQIDKDDHTAQTNLAHSYLMTNQFDKAKNIYLTNHKNNIMLDNNKSWTEICLEDFEIMKKEGINHPDMIKIEALMK